MDLAMIGLGKMGANMARRLVKGGHQVSGYDRSAETVSQLANEIGLISLASLAQVAEKLPVPRAVWGKV
jgi:6-phosphogluconate dehydrogenase